MVTRREGCQGEKDWEFGIDEYMEEGVATYCSIFAWRIPRERGP